MGRLLYGYWDCEYCGKTAIRGDIRECPGCGKPRGEHTKFYMHKKEYVEPKKAERINRNPDWICAFCDQLNSDNDTVCISCGATREESSKTYFDARNEEAKREEYVSRTLEHKYVVTSTMQEESKPHEPRRYETTFSDRDDYIDEDNGNPYRENVEAMLEKQRRYEEENPSFGERLSRVGKSIGKFFSKNFIPIIVTLLVISIIGGIVYLCIPKEHELTVQSMKWERSIAIEKYDWVDESDWNLPHGAKLRYTNEEIYSYVEVIDHYEIKTREVIVGYESKVTGYRDLGNGYFEEIVEQVPVYGTEEYEEPVYRSQPVYQTKYYYKIQRWIHSRNVNTNGHDLSPFWGEFTLAKNERKGSSSETYTIVGIDEDGEEMKVTMSYDDYMKMEIGASVKVKVSFGHAEIILD